MLTQSYLAACPAEIVKIYSQLETEVLALIAKRLAKSTDKSLELSAWQMQVLRECGLLRGEVEKLIAKYDKEAQKELLRLFDEAMRKSAENDLRLAERGLDESQRQHLETLSDRLQSPDRTNKDSNYYAPQKTGVLHKSAVIHSSGSSATITWNPLARDKNGSVVSKTSYAARLYYGDNFKFSKEKNVNAQSHWFDVAKQNRMKDWEKLAQSFFK